MARLDGLAARALLLLLTSACERSPAPPAPRLPPTWAVMDCGTDRAPLGERATLRPDGTPSARAVYLPLLDDLVRTHGVDEANQVLEGLRRTGLVVEFTCPLIVTVDAIDGDMVLIHVPPPAPGTTAAAPVMMASSHGACWVARRSLTFPERDADEERNKGLRSS